MMLFLSFSQCERLWMEGEMVVIMCESVSTISVLLRSAGGSAHVGFLGIGICGERVVKIGE